MKFKRKTFSRSVVSSSPSRKSVILMTVKPWMLTQKRKNSKKEATVQTPYTQTPMMKNGKNSNRSQLSWRLTRRIRTRSAGSAGSQEQPQTTHCLVHASVLVQLVSFIWCVWRSGSMWNDSRKTQRISLRSSGRHLNVKFARVPIHSWSRPSTRGKHTSTTLYSMISRLETI